MPKDADEPTQRRSAGSGDATAILPAGDATVMLKPAGDATATGETPSDATVMLERSDERAAAAPPPTSDDEAPTVLHTIPSAPEEDATMVRPRLRGRPRLILRDAAGSEREVALLAPDVSIGRASTCAVVLENAEVSRIHARIVATGDDHALIAVGARHNTYVNGEAVTGERLLRHGDVIQLASERLIYAETDDVPRAVSTAPAAPSPPCLNEFYPPLRPRP